MTTRESEASFAEDLRYLLNVKLKYIPDRKKAELFGISPASLVNYKKEVGGRTPRGAQAKPFAEAIAFAKAWGEEHDVSERKWESMGDDFMSVSLWEDLHKYITAFRERLGAPHADELRKKVLDDPAKKALGEMEDLIKAMGEDEVTIDLEILKQQIERDKEALLLRYRDLQMVDYALSEGEVEQSEFDRREQISKRARDFFALIEEPLRSTFEELAAEVIECVVGELKKVCWDGREDSKPQFENRIGSALESLERVKMLE